MRKLNATFKKIDYVLAIAMVLFTIMSVFIPVRPWLFRGTHLTFALILVFLNIPAKKTDETLAKGTPSIIDMIFIVVSIAVMLYIYVEFETLIYRVGALPTTVDIIVGIAIVVVVLEASRRAAGAAFMTVALVALAYTVLGKYLPGILGHRGYSVTRTISYVFSVEGIYGSTLRASATFAILFITLGGFLKAFGAEKFFNDFSMAISGHTRGGPGKVAVLASALFGSISGHAAGNVATTGTFTIPMMKRIGYKPSFAGAVEAAASAGGQILPPVMGTVVFVMIELTAIPYQTIIVAGAIPALLYYLAVFLMVDFEAINLNLCGLPKEELPSLKESLKEGAFFIIAIGVLLYMLFIKQSSVTLAAVYTLGTVVVIGFIKIRDPKIVFKKILEGLYSGGRGTMKLAPLTASAGIVIGVVTLTGIGVKLGRFLVMISGGQLFPILLVAMVLSAILGMGMSTIPAYVVAASVVAPALIEIGIPVLAAHLFVLYYACISTITPPIAISSFTAASIADAPPMETAMKAVKLAIVGFIVPFLFVYRPALMARGELSTILYAVVISVISIYALARGLQYRIISIPERILLVAGSLIMLLPGNDVRGLILIAVAYIIYFVLYKKRKAKIEEC
jgi:TRAP transporter 4TM/12TM fusion protein